MIETQRISAAVVWLPLQIPYALQLRQYRCSAGVLPPGSVDQPVDAQKRGIANGDMVRVFNDRGEVRIAAKVTPRILPGVSAMGQGAWHDADMTGDKIDHGACVNTLTTQRPSPLAKGNPQHTNLVEIEKV